MKPLKAQPSDLFRRALRLPAVLLAVVLMAWGFTPHKRLHAVAWSYLPHELRLAWNLDPEQLIERATQADSRKHSDSLEAERHYLDMDDLELDGHDVVGLKWGVASQRLSLGTLGSERRYGVLPWELEASYWRLVRAFSPGDSAFPDPSRIERAAADLGHYLADAHVPLHTSGNYDGQRTNQRGIHALWETHTVEWMLGQDQMRHCPPCDIHEMRYDPVWTPWEIVAESHALAPDVFRAEKTWTALQGIKGYGFRRRGRTLHLVPTKESLATWDSLTHHHTWPRFCLAAQRIASAWHAAWIDAGKPTFTPPNSSPRDESTKLQFTPRRKERLKRENPSPS